MQRSQRTKARFTRLCQIGACLLFVPILLALGCPLTVTITDCPTAAVDVGDVVTLGVSTSGGQGTPTSDTAATNATVGDGTTAAPTVTATGGDIVVTVTATDESGDTASDTCDISVNTPACTDDADCADDGVFCNGTESCDADSSECVHSGDPCDAGDTCDETDGCATPCTAASGCDDDDECTDDACTDGECDNTTINVDDGVFCNGTESCDSATGDVTSSGDPCDATAGEVCDEDLDECTVTECTDDADCTDDGLFCNGTESCDTAASACVSSGDPCAAAGEICEETSGACVGCLVNADCPAATPICTSANTCVECEQDSDCSAGSCVNNICISTISFTIGQDNLFGTAGDDTFDGSLATIEQTGAQVATVQTGDSADGKDGTDTVNASFNAASGTPTVVPTLSNIEILNISDFGSVVTTLDMSNTAGATEINSVNSVQTLTVTDIGSAVNLGINNTDNGLTATYKEAATSGASDAVTLTLTEVDGGTATITTAAASGFETLTVSSTGSAANTLDVLALSGNTTTLKTLNVTGDQAVKLKVVPTSLTTKIDASGMTVTSPGLTLGTGTSVTGSIAYTTFGVFGVGHLTGGPGDDMFIFVNDLETTDASGSTEYIDGGDGTDGIQISLDESLTTTLSFRNIENFYVNAEGAYTLSLINISGIETFYIESDARTSGSQDVLALSNFPDIPSLAYRGDGAEFSQYFDHVTYTSLGATGTSDSLTITVDNRGTALGSSTSANAFRVGAIIASLIETMTVTVADVPTSASTPTTFDDITGNGLNSLMFTVPGALTVGTITGETDLLTTVNFVGVTGRLRMESSGLIDELGPGAIVTLTAYSDGTSTTPITCKGGGTSTGITINAGAGDDYVTLTQDGTNTFILNGEAGEDTLTGSAGVDTIDGGTGDDTIVGSGGVDSLTGGSGNDTITGGGVVDTISGGAGTDTITAGAGADVLSGGTGNDTYVQTSNDAIDTISDFAAGTSSTSEDTITFSLAALEGYGTVDDLVTTDLTTLTATDAITYAVLASDGATPGSVGIIGIIGDYADATAALAAKTSWTVTFGGTAAANDGFLIAYTSGSNVRIAIAVNTATTTSDGIDSVTDLIILTGVSLSNLDSGDFNALGA